ncbi:Uncharacterised protein [Candidatus Norongarragalina meridionalis]|nr:Uncharacterised protein [Candidatus Norongarragalina meridionalis]
MITLPDFLLKALLAIAAVGLIGLERERSRHPLIGTRTLALASFLGMLLASIDGSLLLPAIGLIGSFALAALYYYFKAMSMHEGGLTTTLMIPFVYLLGAMFGMGLYMEAGIAAIASTYLLVEKKEFHSLARTVSKEEIIDMLILAIIAFIIYPQLPDAPIDVFSISFNPRFFWTIVVVFSALSFAVHIIAKYFHERAVVYAALASGFVSSLATVAVFSKKTTDRNLLFAVLLVSSAGSILSDVAILLVASPALLASASVFMALSFVLFLAFAWKRLKNGMRIPVEREPLSLRMAFEFAVIFLVVNLMLGWMATNYPGLVYLSALFGGVLSSTSVFASIAYLFATGAMTAKPAVTCLFLGAFGSMCAKAGYLAWKAKMRGARLAEPFAILLFAWLACYALL